MPKSVSLYAGECRFTDRTLEVGTHGHGIKLSIRSSPAKGDVVSVFLDAGELDELRQSLRADSGNKKAEELLKIIGGAIARAGY